VDVRFRGELFFWRGPSPWHFIAVPEHESAMLEAAASAVTYGWGMVPVTAKIGGTEWRTSLFPKDGRYVVPVKQWVRDAEALDLGDASDVALHLDL
jgi:hypothetical protein